MPNRSGGSAAGDETLNTAALPASDFRIRNAAVAALGRRLRTADALASELEAAGIDLGVDGADRLEGVLDWSSEFVELDGGWVGVAAQLDGTRWITAVDADDAKSGVLALDPDLVLFEWWLLDTTVTLGESRAVLEVVDDVDAGDVLTGPLGWLDSYAGVNVEVRVSGTTLHLAPAPVMPRAAADMVDAVRAIFEQHATPEVLRDTIGTDAVDLTQMALDDLLWHALVDARDAFAAGPIPPVEVLLGESGLVRERRTVLRSDADIDALTPLASTEPGGIAAWPRRRAGRLGRARDRDEPRSHLGRG